MKDESKVYRASSLTATDKLSGNTKVIRKGFTETDPKMRRNSARKRKSDDIDDICLDEILDVIPEFNRMTKPAILNSRDAFFDRNDSSSSYLGLSPIESCIDKECVIKAAKSFIDDEDREARQANNKYSPRGSPACFRRQLQSKPLQNITSGGTPCGVVDEFVTGFYGCMPAWECSLPWTDDDYDSSDDEGNQRYMIRRDTARHDAQAVREHLAFPKHLGREYVSQSEESHRERKTTMINRTIRRSPSSRMTTLESDSRQKLPGSKMFRRTEFNKVTEIHWDEEVLDMNTLEQMANLSVS
jgi:hypothetical protein